MIKVFTNGIFDLIHKGHIDLLKYAKSLGDYLIVNVNCDDAVRRLKGPLRPIQNEDTRLAVIRELKCVDDVFIFYQDTPEYNIKLIKPDILVKGPEEIGKEIPGASIVLGYGGKVVVPNWPIRESTTLTIEKIVRLYGNATSNRT